MGVKRTSQYNGVTLMKNTNKWRAQKNTQSLGEYDTEEKAAQAFDQASINLYGYNAKLNFPFEQYETEVESIMAMSFNDVAQKLRDQAVTATPTSQYRGVSYLNACKKWRAQINITNKQHHLGYFQTEEEAAMVFDRASIVRGVDKKKTKTNFDIQSYEAELPYILDISIEDLQRTLNDEKFGWKLAKKVLSTGQWQDLSQFLNRPIEPRCFDDCQSRIIEVNNQNQQIQRTRKRNFCCSFGSKYESDHLMQAKQQEKTELGCIFNNNVQNAFEDYQLKRIKLSNQNEYRTSAGQRMESSQSQYYKNQSPGSSHMGSDHYYSEGQAIKTPQQQKVEKLEYNQNIHPGKENVAPDRQLWLNCSQNGNQGFHVSSTPFDKLSNLDNYYGSSYSHSQYSQTWGNQQRTANGILISLMKQAQFPPEIVTLVEDFDTDISQVRHAGSWKILRFMIQYSPQEFDNRDDMWLTLQNFIDVAIDWHDRQWPIMA